MAFQGDSIYWVEVEKVVPNPFQPRREFDQHKLQELADSIRMYGVLQPLTVTRNEIHRDDGTFYSEYELIAGERRLRASKLAGVAQVPVIIRDGEQNEQEKLELAIIENLQREDLNAVDRALAFQQLSDVFKLSHAQVAQKMGRSREYVSNSIRLLALPEHILTSLKRGELSEGHARTLLMLNDKPEEQEVIFREILLKKLSVREVERIVRKIATDKVRKKTPGEFDAFLIEFEKQFTETLGTRVQIQKTEFGGKLTIDYFSNDDLEVILKRIKDEGPIIKTPSQKEIAARLSEHTPLEVVENDSTVAKSEASESNDFSNFISRPADNQTNSNPEREVSGVNNQVAQAEVTQARPFEEEIAVSTQTQRTEFAYNPPTHINPPVSHIPTPTPAKESYSPDSTPEKTENGETMAGENLVTPQNIPTQPQPQNQYSPWTVTANNQPQSRPEDQNQPPVQPNPLETPNTPVKPKIDVDDSNLYSINNFTV